MTRLFNRAINLSVLLFVLFALQGYSQTLQDSLLIHYKFNGDSIDYSGNGFDPTLFRATYTDDAVGNPNSAIYFNGIDDLIILPDTQALKPNFPITISFWIKMDNLSTESNVFFTNDFYRFSHSGVWLNLSSSQQMAVGIGDGSGFGLYTRRTKITDVTLQSNVWYLVSTVLWSVDDMRIYINGVEELGSMEGSANYMAYIGTGGNIGRKDANYELDPYFYKGYFDDFRYWNRGLSEDEIYSLYEDYTGVLPQNKNDELSIYPNPATDYLFIKAGVMHIDKIQIDIFDLFGKRVLRVVNAKKVDIQCLQSEIYFVKITIKGNNESVINKTFFLVKN